MGTVSLTLRALHSFIPVLVNRMSSFFKVSGVMLLIVVTVTAWAGNHITRRWSRTVRALADGISSLRDRDFSVNVTRATQVEMGELVDAYNPVGD